MIIQCKRYRKESFVRENTVFQLHGTSVLYQIKNPGVKVIPAIYSSAPLSDMAAKCAKHLGIVVRDRIPLEDYPMIKCNISSSGERIYHLPFDQQYDRVRIIPDRGEKYVDTVGETEAAVSAEHGGGTALPDNREPPGIIPGGSRHYASSSSCIRS